MTCCAISVLTVPVNSSTSSGRSFAGQDCCAAAVLAASSPAVMVASCAARQPQTPWPVWTRDGVALVFCTAIGPGGKCGVALMTMVFDLNSTGASGEVKGWGSRKLSSSDRKIRCQPYSNRVVGQQRRRSRFHCRRSCRHDGTELAIGRPPAAAAGVPSRRGEPHQKQPMSRPASLPGARQAHSGLRIACGG